MEKQKMGIRGTGEVGRALGRGFVNRGCEVRIGTRDPSRMPPGASAGRRSTSAASKGRGARADVLAMGDRGMKTGKWIHAFKLLRQ
jgi:predicted dinucleotide-binding enzyme